MTEEKAPMAFDSMLEEQLEEAESTGQKNDLALFSNQADLTVEDITIPRLRLAQGLTKEVQEGNAKPGQWILTGVAPREEIVATVIAVAKFQRLNNDADGSVLCRSEDGITGIGDPGGICKECPMNQWVNSTTGGKNTPPACQFGYRYLLDVENYGQCIYEMKRTAINAAKALNGMIVRHGYGSTHVVIRAQKATGNRGAFYTPVIVPLVK
jgi:hypothetical protein